MSNDDINQSFKNIIAALNANPGICSIDDVFKEIEKVIEQTNEIDITLLSKYVYTIINTIMHKNSGDNNRDSQVCNDLLNSIMALPNLRPKERRRLLG